MIGLAGAALLLILFAGWRTATVLTAPAALDSMGILRMVLNFAVVAIVCIGLLRRSRVAALIYAGLHTLLGLSMLSIGRMTDLWLLPIPRPAHWLS